MGDYEQGEQFIDEAASMARNSDSKDDMPGIHTTHVDSLNIQEATNMRDDAVLDILPYEIPEGRLYKPQEENVKNLKKVEYFGASKVVAGSSAQDGFNGFSGRQVKVCWKAYLKEQTLGRDYRRKMAAEQENNTKTLPKQVPKDLNLQPTLSRRAPVPRNQSTESLNRPKSVLKRRTSSLGSSIAAESDMGFPEPVAKEYKAPSTYPRTSSRAYSITPTDSISEQGSQNSEKVPQPLTKIKFKVHYDDTRLLQLPEDIIFDDLLSAIQRKFKEDRIMVKFIDEEGNRTVMANNDDLDEAIDVSPNPNTVDLWAFIPA